MTNALEAIEHLKCEGRHAQRQPRLPHLVLLDINMPQMNGFDVLRSLRSDACTRNLPIVMCSTSTDERDMHASRTGGADGYLVKPVTLTELHAALRLMLKERAIT